jgi:hypothetical protein
MAYYIIFLSCENNDDSYKLLRLVRCDKASYGLGHNVSDKPATAMLKAEEETTLQNGVLL